ncbi:hypothetical protein [Cellulomonas sp. GbtcB1]|uniref:hypothetical protein n=1 Tax=Cellulomonas sp. GbtcB1 TaxID=2824746 RepID=UPI001C2FFE7D|nr:hypothetical protein [Cellulomonas sp. GbtcB1]
MILRRHVRPGRVGPDVGLVSWVVLCLGGTVATWYLAGRWVPVLSVPALDTVTLWQATWPVLLGLGLAAVGAVAVRAGLVPPRLRAATIPRGDLVAVLGGALDVATTARARSRRERPPADAPGPPDEHA